MTYKKMREDDKFGGILFEVMEKNERAEKEKFIEMMRYEEN